MPDDAPLERTNSSAHLIAVVALVAVLGGSWYASSEIARSREIAVDLGAALGDVSSQAAEALRLANALRQELSRQERQIAALQAFVFEEEGFVDLTTSKIQKINEGFAVGGAAVKPHLSGVSVTGRVINLQSVHHESVDFEIALNGQSRDFMIVKIVPGGGAKFSVDVPDVDPTEVKSAQLKFKKSTVAYIPQ